jgi:hypothetical protein
MARGRLTLPGRASFFKIRMSAKQNETTMNVKIEAE